MTSISPQVLRTFLAVCLTILSACGGGGAKVAVADVVEAPLRKTVVASGRVSSAVQVQLGALVGGRVAATPVKAGARVQEGQLLLQLQDAAERAALAQAEAGLRQAQLQLDEAERQYQRQKEMSQLQAISAAQFDSETNRRDLARNQVAVSRAALDAARARLAETQILAPAEGVVLRRDVEVGNLVQAGAAVMGLAVKGPVEIRVDADERYLSTLALGQEATVIADAFPDRPFRALVSEIAPLVDRQRGTVEVRLAAPDAPDFLLNDMTASAEINVARLERALVLPLAALHESDGETWVWRVLDGQVQRQAVKLGLRGDTGAQVSEGLAAGERVVADATELKPGQSVRAAGAD